jgi:hypothetical protein
MDFESLLYYVVNIKTVTLGMGIILMMTALIVFTIILSSIYFYSKRTGHCMVVLISFGMWIFLMKYTIQYERWVISKFKIPVQTVESGNRIAIEGLMKQRTLILVDIPDEAVTKEELDALLKKKRLKIELLSHSADEKEPWRAKALLNNSPLPTLLAERRSNKTQIAVSSTDALRHTASKLDSVIQYAKWIVAGLCGASLLGQALAGSAVALVFVGLILYFAGSNISDALKVGTTIVPPTITFVVTLLYGGHFKKVIRIQELRRKIQDDGLIFTVFEGNYLFASDLDKRCTDSKKK